MDFLDPHKRRTYTIRLLIGYFLLTVAILLGTVILVYAAYGYGINTKTGQIIQNGLVFVDSQPSGAKISLNGKDQGSVTSARLIIPSGDYALSLTKQGYREWKKDFTLNEHSIQRFTYPLLIPQQPVLKVAKDYEQLPKAITQSPDKHWLLALDASISSNDISIDQFDMTNLSKVPDRLSLPSGVFKNIDGTFQVVAWSSDNSHLLVSHIYNEGAEYALLNRSDTASSFNVNALFNQNPAKVSLVNNKSDQLYLYDGQTRDLKIADVAKGTIAPVLLKNVIDFKALSGNLVLYITDKSAQTGQVEAHIFDGNGDYKLSTINQRSSYVLDASQYQGHWYYAVTSSNGTSINIFEDPIQDIKDPLVAKALVIEAISLSLPDNAGFSNNGRFLLASQGAVFSGYDFDSKAKIKFSLSSQPFAPAQWLDNYHLTANLAGNLIIMDYDGANQQSLSPDSYYQGAYLSKDSKHLVFTKDSAGSAATLINLSLQLAN